ncbi:MAG: glutathione S-transferase family protein, partial [Deltaproteobacteria bacterium]
MSEDKIIVFSYRRCPFAMRVRIALHEKGIPFEVKEEDLKNFSDELKQLHPEVKVPLLVHGNRVIYESAIIAEYIDDLRPEINPLMPKTPGERSEVRLWTYWCNYQFKTDIDRFKYGTHRFKEEECVGAEERLKNHLA